KKDLGPRRGPRSGSGRNVLRKGSGHARPQVSVVVVVFVLIGVVLVDGVVEEHVAPLEDGLLHEILEREADLELRAKLLALELLDVPVTVRHAHVSSTKPELLGRKLAARPPPVRPAATRFRRRACEIVGVREYPRRVNVIRSARAERSPARVARGPW